MSSGERPIGAAKGKQSDTEALCHPPPPTRAAARQNNELRMVAMTICLCHGGIYELSIRCSWPTRGGAPPQTLHTYVCAHPKAPPGRPHSAVTAHAPPPWPTGGPGGPSLCLLPPHVPLCPQPSDVLKRPYTVGGEGDLPFLPFQCWRLTAKILPWRLRCQEDLSLKNFRPAFGGDHRGTQGGGRFQPKSPSPPSDSPSPPF